MAGGIDREAAGSFDITVRATSTDGSFSTQAFTIGVTPVNDNDPVITSPNSANVAENTTPVLTVTATDADLPAQTVTYSITGGADQGKFSINGTTGELTFSAAPDYENPTDADTNNVYVVQVTASDGAGRTVNQTINVTVTPVNDNDPVITSANTANVAENTTAVLTVTATDADLPAQTPSYSISGGADQAKFSINGTTGELTFSAAPDYENPTDADTNNIYVVQVTANDGAGRSVNQTINVTVTPVNDNDPVITSANTANVAENTTPVLTVTATDADLPAQTLSYSISGGADQAKFSINGTTGDLTFSAAPDYENPTDADTNNVYVVQVTASDGAGRTTNQTINVTVTPVNDNDPVITSSNTANVAENTTAVLTVTATDADLPAQTVTYSITGGADQAKFSINGTTGELTFSAAPDYENPTDADTNNIYVVQVTANDGAGRSVNQTINVTVTPVNDNDPAITSANAANVAENTTAVLTVTATDADLPAQTLSYSITGGADQAKFSINGTTGDLTFSAAPDYENPTDADTNNIYVVQVTASDGAGRSVNQTISVTVTNVNESGVSAISDIDASADYVVENSGVGTPVGITANATDPDATDTVTYSLDNDAGGRFAVDANTGVITVAGAIDREAAGTYNVTVRATSTDTSFSTRTFTITIGDVDEFDVGPVTDTDATPNAVDENAAVGTPVGLIASATDADATNNTITYSLDDDAGGRFTINGPTGLVTVTGALDYETAISHSITVRATSTDGSFSTQAFTISVTPVNDNDPVITSGNTANVAENTTAVLTVTATDADLPAQTMTYSITGGADQAKFSINATTGDLTFSAAPDYENPTDADTNNIYVVQVTASDGAGRSVNQTINVTVTPVNDNDPVITSAIPLMWRRTPQQS